MIFLSVSLSDICLSNGENLKYPNSGTLVKELHNFLKNRTLRRDEEVNSLISILMNIAFRNPRIYPEAVAILSKFLELLPTNEKKVVIENIQTKFKSIA